MASITRASFELPSWLRDLDAHLLAYDNISVGQRLRSNCARVEIPSWKHADGFYRPRHSMKDLLCYFIRAQIFFVQLAVDPEFRLSVPLPALSVDDRAAVRTALGRVLEQLVRLPPYSSPWPSADIRTSP